MTTPATLSESASLQHWKIVGFTDTGEYGDRCSQCGTRIRYRIEIEAVDNPDESRGIGSDCAERVGLNPDQIKRLRDSVKSGAAAARDQIATVTAVAEPYLGTPGAKLTVTATVERSVYCKPYRYGAASSTLYIMRADGGQTVATKTAAKQFDAVKVGDRLELCGTVKHHDLYRSTPQTVMTRCKVMPAVSDAV